MTPVQRAAKAIADPGVRGMCDKGCECEDDLVLTRWVARRALEAATRDVDELALAIHHQVVRSARAGFIDIEVHGQAGIDFERTIACAVVAHLTKGDENDE